MPTHPLLDNGQAIAWCNKVNGKTHATTNEIPFERLKKKALVVNPNHYKRLTVKQSFDIENTLLEGNNVIDFPIQPPSLRVYDAVAEVAQYE